MDNAKYLPPKAGSNAASLILRGKQARIDLSASSPSLEQAIRLTRALVAHWTSEASDDRMQSITLIWLRFPLPVCAACVHSDGITNQKIRDLRTGNREVRRWLPSDPEIRQWCNQYMADLYDTVKAGEIAERPIASPPIAPERKPPSPEEVARVWRLVNEIKERCNRVIGIPTAEEQRIAAARILEAAQRKC